MSFDAFSSFTGCRMRQAPKNSYSVLASIRLYTQCSSTLKWVNSENKTEKKKGRNHIHTDRDGERENGKDWDGMGWDGMGWYHGSLCKSVLDVVVAAASASATAAGGSASDVAVSAFFFPLQFFCVCSPLCHILGLRLFFVVWHYVCLYISRVSLSIHTHSFFSFIYMGKNSYSIFSPQTHHGFHLFEPLDVQWCSKPVRVRVYAFAYMAMRSANIFDCMLYVLRFIFIYWLFLLAYYFFLSDVVVISFVLSFFSSFAWFTEYIHGCVCVCVFFTRYVRWIGVDDSWTSPVLWKVVM